MITLVTGGSGSGKSEYAESLLGEDELKYYIATMHNDNSEDAQYRIARHRKLRESKNFITIEKEYAIDECVADIEEDGSVIIECMSNLLANEMYIKGAKNPVDYIVSHVAKIAEKCSNLVIVTLEVGADGIIYDDFTNNYIANLARLNAKLADISDRVFEVVYSIPIKIKG